MHAYARRSIWRWQKKFPQHHCARALMLMDSAAEIVETLEDRIRAVIRVGALREREYPASVAVRVMLLCASCLRLLHGFKRGGTASMERGTHVPAPMTDQGIWL